MKRGGGCFLLAAFAIRLVAACSSTNGPTYSAADGGPASTVDAGAAVSQNAVGTLALDIVTGADSLRLDSDATATINYLDGTSESLALPFYSGGAMSPTNFTEGSTTHIETTVSSKQPIASLELSLVSHPLQDLESNDSWTVKEVRAAVAYGDPDSGAKTCVLDRAGGTVTDGQPVIVKAGGCTTGGLKIIVVTGGDDLRGDSTASVTVNYENGAADQSALTQGFPAGSTVEVDLGVANPQPITSLTFKMQSHPGTFESSDSWSIKQVEALIANDDASPPMCIINANGETITDNVVLTVYPGGCPTETDGGQPDASDDASTDASTD